MHPKMWRSCCIVGVSLYLGGAARSHAQLPERSHPADRHAIMCWSRR